jgi:dolichol-phosphate mannosyltransferase
MQIQPRRLETNDSDRETADLAVVIPTFNERENIRPLLARLEAALNGIRWEAIFVDDDSPDGTADLVRQLARENPHVRVVHRIGRRGLTSASRASFLHRPPISL